MLGGTEFVGRAVVEAALARGWDVTVFHRGRHEPPAGARSLLGDRTSPDGLAALAGATDTWDAVVDTWSAAPRPVRDAARLLVGRVSRHVYVSSCSVYAWPRAAGYTENAPLVEGASAGADASDYARDKRGGELAAVEAFGGGRSLLVRCGLILGPYENIGRLPWWLNRIAAGGPVLAPGPRDLPLQYIDVRDLAEWTLGAVEAELGGAYNLAGPRGTARWGRCSTRASVPPGHGPSSAGRTPRPCSPPGSSRGRSCRCGCRPGASCMPRCTRAMSHGRCGRDCGAGPSRRPSRTHGAGSGHSGAPNPGAPTGRRWDWIPWWRRRSSECETRKFPARTFRARRADGIAVFLGGIRHGEPLLSAGRHPSFARRSEPAMNLAVR